MNKAIGIPITFIFVFALICAGKASAASDKVVRLTKVDTMAAVAIMKACIEKENKPIFDEIGKLNELIQKSTLKKKLITDSLIKVKYLIDNFDYKIKDKLLAEYYLAYFTEVFEKTSVNGILALAKVKDVEKARKNKKAEEAIIKLFSKTREKALKKISQGKLEAPFIVDTLHAHNARFRKSIDRLDNEIDKWTESLGEIKKKLKKVPPFGRKQYVEITGDAAIPIKEQSVSIASLGDDYCTYAQLAKQYPDLASQGITGKFDGFIEDRLALFPFGEKKTIDWGEDKIIALNNVIVKSEKGTVADLILNCETLRISQSDPQFGYDEFGLNLGMETVSGIWSTNDLAMDGLKIEFSPREPFSEAAGESDETMFVFEEGGWICKTPLETEYLTYDECMSLWSDFFQERGVGMSPAQIRFNTECGNGEKALMWFPFGNPDDIKNKGGLAKLVNPEIVFKCSDMPDLRLPATNFKKWKVAENFFGDGNDGLVVSYEYPPEKGGAYADVYQIVFDGPFWYSLNGIERYSEFGWQKKCTVIEDLKTRELLPIEISGNNSIFNMTKILEGSVVSKDENELKVLIMINRLTDESIADISVIAWVDGEFMGSLKPELYSDNSGEDYRINMPEYLLPKFEQAKGCILSGKENVLYCEGQMGQINELMSIDDNIFLKIDGKYYSGKLKLRFIYGNDALAKFVGKKFADSYDETPEFIRCQGVNQSSCKNLTLRSSQAKTLLEGVVYGGKVNEATILSTTRLGKNWLIEYNVDDGRLYDAIYTPQGILLDALYLGSQPKLNDTGSWDNSQERTRAERCGPNRIKVSVFKAIKDTYGLNAYQHEFSYIISDGAFILESADWNEPECANPYKWAYIQPAEFLRRFPESQTPWELWYELSRKVDGENAEGFWWNDMPALYRRNRDAFFKQAASDMLNNRKTPKIALEFLKSAVSEEYLETGELMSDISRIKDPKTREIILNIINNQ